MGTTNASGERSNLCDKNQSGNSHNRDSQFQLVLKLGDLMASYRGAKAVMVAAELDIFRLIERTGGNVKKMAGHTGVTVRYLQILLDALTSLDFIKKESGRYKNTTFSKEWLHPDGENSLANNLRYQEFLSTAYADLSETFRRGRPVRDLRALLTERPKFVSNYIRGMAEIARGPSQALARALDLSKISNMLDVGGGPGLFTLACLQRTRRLRAVILDLPETLCYTKVFVENAGLENRVELRSGDYHTAAFGKNCFDLVLLSHVTHDESPPDNIALIRKACAALRRGGLLVIHDFMTQCDHTKPLFSVLFSLHLATYTASGQTYGEEDYLEWLRKAGLKAKRIPINAEMPNATMVLVAKKE